MRRKRRIPVICIASQKGGVGKTTTAAALIDGLRMRGRRVLAIDCDPQGSLSSVQGPYLLEGNASTDELFTGGGIAGTVDGQATTMAYEELDYIRKGDGIDESSLGRAIDAAVAEHGFDIVVIDTHPDKSFCTLAALLAASHIIIPVKPSGTEISGVGMMLSYLRDVGEVYGRSWEIASVITMCKRSRLSDEMIAQIRAEFPAQGVELLDPAIHHHVMVDRAQSLGESLFKPGAVLRSAAREYDIFVDSVGDWIRRETR